MSHEFKDDVDKFMNHINVRKESDKMLRDTEYMLYELIDNAMEEGVLHAQRD